MKRVALLAMLLAGCDTIECKHDAPDVHVAPECFQACDLSLPIITEDPATIADAAVTERAALKQCALKRQLCAAAIKRAQEAGAIK